MPRIVLPPTRMVLTSSETSVPSAHCAPIGPDRTPLLIRLSRQRSNTQDMTEAGFSQSLEGGLGILAAFTPTRPSLGVGYRGKETV